jgi:hypothetical protein
VIHEWKVKVVEYVPRIISAPRTYVITETKDTSANKTAAGAAAGAGNRTTYVIYGSGSADSGALVPESQETTQYVINTYDIESYGINETADSGVVYIEDYKPGNSLVINTYTITE